MSRARLLPGRAGAALVAALSLAGPALADDLATGRQLFTQGASPPCAVCHTLRDAGSEGMIGPVLDEIRPDAARVTKALRNGLGQMPSYRESLTDAQIEALARYVSKATGAAK